MLRNINLIISAKWPRRIDFWSIQEDFGHTIWCAQDNTAKDLYEIIFFSPRYFAQDFKMHYFAKIFCSKLQDVFKFKIFKITSEPSKSEWGRGACALLG